MEEEQQQEQRVLSIQSHVVSGCKFNHFIND
jgi:hypothetical protein